jgi:putative transcriptional regulator
MSEHEEASLFERLKKGMRDSIAYSKGELTLVTIELPVPPPKPGPRDILSLRRRHRMSQAVFAAVVNVSVKTVQSWEQGVRPPNQAALRMLQVLRREPEIVQKIFSWTPEDGSSLKRGRRKQKVG